MYCPKCGAEMKEGSQFCTKCGNKLEETKSPKQPEKKTMKLILGIVFGVIAVAGGLYLGISIGRRKAAVPKNDAVKEAALGDSSAKNEDTGEGKAEEESAQDELGYTQLYFETAEDVVLYVKEKLESGEFSSIINAYDVIEKEKNRTLVKMVEKQGGWSAGMIPGLPDTDAYHELRQAEVFAGNELAVKDLIISLCDDENKDLFSPITESKLQEMGGAEGISSYLNVDKLSGLRVERVDRFPLEKLEEQAKKSINENLQFLGQKGTAEYYALYSLGDTLYMGGFTCVKYEKGWVLEALNTPFGGTTSNGAALCTREEYETQITENRAAQIDLNRAPVQSAKMPLSMGYRQLSFPTSDEAVGYVTDKLEKGEYRDILNACAISDYAQNYDFVKQLNQVHGWSAGSVLPFPSIGNLQEVNKLSLYRDYVKTLKILLMTMCADKGESILAPVGGSFLKEIGGASGFYDYLSSDKLKDLKVLRCDKLNLDSIYNYVSLIKERYGVNDAAEYIVLYSVNGRTMIGGFCCIQYDKGWEINGLTSAVAEIDSEGVMEGTEEDYEAILNEFM